MTRGRRGAGGGGGRRRGQDRDRGGFGKISIGEELKIALGLSLKKILESSDETELSRPSSLFSMERAYVHKIAAEKGLQSKSRLQGEGSNKVSRSTCSAVIDDLS